MDLLELLTSAKDLLRRHQLPFVRAVATAVNAVLIETLIYSLIGAQMCQNTEKIVGIRK